MRVVTLDEIRRVLVYPEIIGRMRDALIAQSRGECDTPMPMHLNISAESAEVHFKSSYRRGGRYFVLKMASTFPANRTRGLSTGNGLMFLVSAETGDPVILLADAGYLTDVRTAAVTAMVARELGRHDTVIGILGTGIQARLQALLHAQVLPLRKIVLWGRNSERVKTCREDLETIATVQIAASPAEVAKHARLIVTTTASRQPLLDAVEPQTLISAVGSDSIGKCELSPGILRGASLLLADSRRQCEKLGELQHAPSDWPRAVEIGKFCQSPAAYPANGVIVCDYTGLGIEDLFIAEYCYERIAL